MTHDPITSSGPPAEPAATGGAGAHPPARTLTDAHGYLLNGATTRGGRLAVAVRIDELAALEASGFPSLADLAARIRRRMAAEPAETRAVPSPGRWARFDVLEEAHEQADAGGIAVYVFAGLGAPNLGQGAQDALARGEQVGLLFAVDASALENAAEAIGCNRKWIRTLGVNGRARFEIHGAILERALAACARRPA